MASLLRALHRRLCRHDAKRVYDIHRTADGPFRVRIYCPRCGKRWDVLREAADVARDAAGGNAEMRETMERNLGVEDDRGTDNL